MVEAREEAPDDPRRGSQPRAHRHREAGSVLRNRQADAYIRYIDMRSRLMGLYERHRWVAGILVFVGERGLMYLYER
jgi:hypothetical protein